MIIVTTLITPPLLRSLFARKQSTETVQSGMDSESTDKRETPKKVAPKEVEDVHDHAHSQ
jgi:hypothetical protein